MPDSRYMSIFLGSDHLGVFRSARGISLSWGASILSVGVSLSTEEARRYANLILAQCDTQDAAGTELA